jgi:L-alanine-DL-glutamate epimerase-like enolase superfamily enzyme
MVRQLESVRSHVEAGMDRGGLQPLLPAGGARKAVDCALWDLEAKLERRPVWQIAGLDAPLHELKSPVPIAADESVQVSADLLGLVGQFNVINIKLDKCGGLTEGLAMARAAQRFGLGVMVGNMVGTSLAMAPSYLLGQLCSVVDLDGPVFLSTDRSPAVRYENGMISCPGDLWGAPR